MNMQKRAFIALLCAAMAGIPLAAPAAEGYPNRPIRIIIPSAPGGGPDTIARMVGTTLTEAWGQQIVADNRAGAAGNIGAQIAARAAPDGYTFLVMSAQQVVTPLLFRKPPFNLQRDFSPVCWMVSTPFVLVVTPSLPATSVKELIALAKAKPGTLNYGSSGTGGTLHLITEMFRNMAHIEVVHVPYKSASYMHVDLVAGQVQFAITALPAAAPLMKQGKLRALGVTTPKRTTLAADLEAIAETVPGYEMVGFYGLVAPIKTPEALIMKVNAGVVKALKAGDLQEKLLALGMEPVGSTPAQFGSLLSTQVDALRKTIEASGIQPER